MSSDDHNEEESLEKTSVMTSDTFKVRLAQAGMHLPVWYCLLVQLIVLADSGQLKSPIIYWVELQVHKFL